MPYVVVSDFRFGLDLRRGPLTAAPGTLRRLENAHVNRGAEIEKRKAMVPVENAVLTGTQGLAFSLAHVPIVFGHTSRPATLSDQISYQQLVNVQRPNDPLRRVLDMAYYGGRIYVVAEFYSGDIVHFYDGTRVLLGEGLAFGPTVAVTNSKIYSVSGTQLMFSPVDDPTQLGQGDENGGGFVDVSRLTGRVDDLRTVVYYRDRIAVMGDHGMFMYRVDPDPDRNTIVQRVENIGSVAPRSAIGYSTNDVFFLSRTGVHSLRTRDIQDYVTADSVGDPINTHLLEVLGGVSTEDIQREVFAVIDPTDGRYWLVIGNTAYVFTAFVDSNVAAWSTYTFGFTPTAAACDRSRVYMRDDDQLYLYGGEDNWQYDDTQVTATLPYLDADLPANRKIWDALDASATGMWSIYQRTDPRRPDAIEKLATIRGHTYHELSQPVRANATHLGLEFRTTAAERAILHNCAVHYQTQRAA